MADKLNNEYMEEATFGAGCFWCVESVFKSLAGVHHVESGYSGGHVKNPAYREVCEGRTGHAEVIRVVFDASVLSFQKLLEVFFQTHDPTTLNKQGADEGTQYRSVIFYHDEDQKSEALLAKKAAEESGLWSNPIVTLVEPLDNYYKAEDYHQNYFQLNPNQPYCAAVIRPKMEKFREKFAALLKVTANN